MDPRNIFIPPEMAWSMDGRGVDPAGMIGREVEEEEEEEVHSSVRGIIYMQRSLLYLSRLAGAAFCSTFNLSLNYSITTLQNYSNETLFLFCHLYHNIWWFLRA